MATVKQVIEPKRGCGYRKGGGLYFRNDGAAADCGKLPIPLTVCPHCGAGIKFSRSPQWIMGSLLTDAKCKNEDCTCPIGRIYPGEKYLLVWIGEKHYPMPDDFLNESHKLGISRRIKSVPTGFEVGKTRVFLAHAKAIMEADPDNLEKMIYTKGVFASFIPTRIEYVVKGDESEDELNALEKRGLSLVQVTPEGQVSKEQMEAESDEE